MRYERWMLTQRANNLFWLICIENGKHFNCSRHLQCSITISSWFSNGRAHNSLAFFFCLFRPKWETTTFHHEMIGKRRCFKWLFHVQCVNLSLIVCLAVIIILNCFKLILTTSGIRRCYRIGQNWRTLQASSPPPPPPSQPPHQQLPLK